MQCINIDVWNILINYKRYARKCDDQQQYTDIIETEFFSTPWLSTENSPMLPSRYVTVKKTSVRKSLHQFLYTL